MNLKEIAISKERQCDIINDKILNLKKQEQSIRIELSGIKKAIQNENESLIGRKAICSNTNDG